MDAAASPAPAWFCGAPLPPAVDPGLARRTQEAIEAAAPADDWAELLQRAWPSLEPIFGASPYLAGLARSRPGALADILSLGPTKSLDRLLSQTARPSVDSGETMVRLRRLKAELHLLTALADLWGAWRLEEVTAALTRFADAAVQSALALAAREAAAAAALRPPAGEEDGPVPGFFVVAMGKMGACELNYSSDIDLIVFYDPTALPLAPGKESAAVAIRLTDRMAAILQERTADGYVFRVDLRLRPDPASTRVAVPVPAALEYYETVGQNWERAALIKARPAAGDLRRAGAFLEALQPYIWRRNLDFAAIADIHSIKRQIQAGVEKERLAAAGHDLKLGAGGIREIEFFVQTQQLIAGGRRSQLRAPATLHALEALVAAGHVERAAADELSGAYRTLRALEHRVQMVHDEQTHRLPRAEAERRRVAALAGYRDLRTFDAVVARTLRTVDRRYGELFAGEEALASRFGSLVFTGVEDDPETLETLQRMGFSRPKAAAAAIRSWHHGHIAATRTERGRELLTRLAPRLLEASRVTGAPDLAFERFSAFFSALKAGVQVQSLFLARPKLLELVVKVMACAPEFARDLARRPAALDALLDPTFFAPLTLAPGSADRIAGAGGFEAAMDAARRAHREEAFRIGMQLLAGLAGASQAGGAFSDLADAIATGLCRASLEEVGRVAGEFNGEVALVALGKWGSREMTARSDLDLMTLYRAREPATASSITGLSADTFYARFTQRLVAALSAPTAEGTLYQADLQLRPSGTKGPVAVSFAAFEDYYEREAEVWELLAMTRARVVWASSREHAEAARSAIDTALRRKRDRAATAREVRAMRALMAAERPSGGFWDMKLCDGGLVDIEFAAQYLQLCHAADGGPLRANTAEALTALAAAGLGEPAPITALAHAWRLQQDLSQILKVALPDDADPAAEPKALQGLLAKAGGARSLRSLVRNLEAVRAEAHGAFTELTSG
ncbi:MAG TPA: bifunctional [glutamine synthetase] adenylyltransferase/[glutamine synthetase]-adenylyl-L-tyrosine phosphorylase [Caulobacteraceae bacterium]|nr:bifunctional [glutamine synthetase] adenylyltransferase/[glutamine synthetase]-adenylyl-L-tyrosine phosphorylase [Caulobacteraceae bacterium]